MSQKSHFPLNGPPKARADHESRRSTRAFIKPAEPGKPASQGVKHRRATSDLHDNPDNCEPTGHHSRRTSSPQTGRSPGPQQLTTWAGRALKQACPPPQTRRLMARELPPTDRHDCSYLHLRLIARPRHLHSR